MNNKPYGYNYGRIYMECKDNEHIGNNEINEKGFKNNTIRKGGKTVEGVKKIITRASYGQGVKICKNTVHIGPYEEGEKPDDVLGCIIGGAQISDCSFEGDDKNGKKVRVNSRFDVHIWYRINNDTRVSKFNAEFSDIVKVPAKGTEKYSHEEVRAWIQEAPKCIGTKIIKKPEGTFIAVQTEYGVGAEIIGQTTLNVKVFYNTAGDDQDEELMYLESEEFMDDYEDD